MFSGGIKRVHWPKIGVLVKFTILQSFRQKGYKNWSGKPR